MPPLLDLTISLGRSVSNWLAVPKQVLAFGGKMKLKVTGAAFTALVSLSAQTTWAASTPQGTAEQPSLSQCIALHTTGADRILTARWLFAVMAKSPQIADLAAVTPERTAELDKAFARLMVRIANQDCINQLRPLAAGNLKDAFEQVGKGLGETAMGELMGGKEVDKGIAAYTEYLSEDDFKPLMDGIPTSRSK